MFSLLVPSDGCFYQFENTKVACLKPIEVCKNVSSCDQCRKICINNFNGVCQSVQHQQSTQECSIFNLAVRKCAENTAVALNCYGNSPSLVHNSEGFNYYILSNSSTCNSGVEKPSGLSATEVMQSVTPSGFSTTSFQFIPNMPTVSDNIPSESNSQPSQQQQLTSAQSSAQPEKTIGTSDSGMSTESMPTAQMSQETTIIIGDTSSIAPFETSSLQPMENPSVSNTLDNSSTPVTSTLVPELTASNINSQTMGIESNYSTTILMGGTAETKTYELIGRQTLPQTFYSTESVNGMSESSAINPQTISMNQEVYVAGAANTTVVPAMASLQPNGFQSKGFPFNETSMNFPTESPTEVKPSSVSSSTFLTSVENMTISFGSELPVQSTTVNMGQDTQTVPTLKASTSLLNALLSQYTTPAIGTYISNGIPETTTLVINGGLTEENPNIPDNNHNPFVPTTSTEVNVAKFNSSTTIPEVQRRNRNSISIHIAANNNDKYEP